MHQRSKKTIMNVKGTTSTSAEGNKRRSLNGKLRTRASKGKDKHGKKVEKFQKKKVMAAKKTGGHHNSYLRR